MAVSYNKLWKLLIDRKMSQAELRRAAEIAPNTMTRMRKDQEVSLAILDRICDTLNVDYGDIIQHVTATDANTSQMKAAEGSVPYDAESQR